MNDGNPKWTPKSTKVGIAIVALLAVLISLAFCTAAKAQVACPAGAVCEITTVTWTAPTSNTDGSPILATGPSALVGFRVEWGTCGAGNTFNPPTAGVLIDFATPGPTVRSFQVNQPKPSTWCFRLNASNATNASAWTTPVSKTTLAPPPPVPNPPPSFQITQVVPGVNVSPIFKVLPSGARSSAISGFVEVGTPCDPTPVFTYRGQTYHRIDPAYVDNALYVHWWASEPSLDGCAACASSA